MAKTYGDRLWDAFGMFADGLQPWIETQLQVTHGDQWQTAAAKYLRPKDAEGFDGTQLRDPSILFSMMLGGWNECFSFAAPLSVRGVIFDLKDARNKYAHREDISSDYAVRALDWMIRVSEELGLSSLKPIREQYEQIQREKFESRSKNKRSQADRLLKMGAAGDLKAWRDVVSPHPDVQSGRFQQAEFAADLSQVQAGEATDEYQDAKEFYRRTYLTEGIKYLLKNTVERLSGAGGDPVMELRTNFGGGKTHSMIALWHAAGDTPASDLVGLSDLLAEWGLDKLPNARRVVLHGVAMQPGKAVVKEDGTRVNTMWGELAWQLGGRDAYEQLRELDENGTYPGSNLLYDLFKQYGPVLILIDEWIRYIGPTYRSDTLPGGSFDDQFSFAQALTEAARKASNVMLVASIPQSEGEGGGEAGEEALRRLMHVFGRMETAWRPASPQEGFEIVIRRLFQPITDQDQFDARDVVVGAFRKMYAEHGKEFPSGTGELEYERRMRATYPVHPELFDRLFEDWAQMESFQRTRGVLRLMANVIHNLWDEGDQSRLIMPGSVPIDDKIVQHELTRYLDHGWPSVIESDIDGDNAVSRAIDRDNPSYQRVSATRRVARTVYLGSAPLGEDKGISEQQVRFGSVQPGEPPAIFSDALRRLVERGTHVYRDGDRYWLSPRANLNRTAKDYADAANELDVTKEIVDRLEASAQKHPGRDWFTGVVIAPEDGGRIADEARTQLVVLGPEYPNMRGKVSPARERARELLLQRTSGGQRVFQNTLLFLAADSKLVDDLKSTVRRFLGWQRVLDEKGDELAGAQLRQAKQNRDGVAKTLDQQVLDTWNQLLVPSKRDAQGDIEWDDEQAKGAEPIVEKSGRAAVKATVLTLEYSPKLLRMELDKWLWNQADVSHRDVKQLWEWFSTYLYLPRLRDLRVFTKAIEDAASDFDGVSSYFSYAAAWDEGANRYENLTRPGSGLSHVHLDGQSVLVKPDVALAQIAAEDRELESITGSTPASTPPVTAPDPTSPGSQTGSTITLTGSAEQLATHYFGAVGIDPSRFIKDGNEVYKQVIAHLVGLDPSVRISIEIQASVPGGIPREVMRVVKENADALQFDSSEFEAR